MKTKDELITIAQNLIEVTTTLSKAVMDGTNATKRDDLEYEDIIVVMDQIAEIQRNMFNLDTMTRDEITHSRVYIQILTIVSRNMSSDEELTKRVRKELNIKSREKAVYDKLASIFGEEIAKRMMEKAKKVAEAESTDGSATSEPNGATSEPKS